MPLSPDQGSSGGHTEVILTGSNFTGAYDVSFGSNRAASFTVVNNNTIIATTPIGCGAVRVTVTTPRGTGFVGYFYYLPPPVIRFATPSVGPIAGGNTVTITGSHFLTASEVRFGTQAVAFTVVSDDKLTVTVPAASAGPVAVTVITRGGTTTARDVYDYLNPPALTSVSPAFGPADGGNQIVLTGTVLSHTTGVTIGGIPVTAYRIVSDTRIEVLVPAGTPGPADVSVTTLGGTTTAVGAYTYRAAFAVLAGQTVTNTGPSVVNGDLGVSPGTAVTGFPPGLVNGTIHSADAAALQAQNDLTVAYDNAASRTPDASISGDLGGLTLAPGVYNAASSIGLTGTLTLDAGGNANAVWVFQVGSTLTTASASSVLLINGAAPRNVYWQIGSSATLGTNTTFVGRILALTSITITTGTTIDGQALARNGSVTMDNNTITRRT